MIAPIPPLGRAPAPQPAAPEFVPTRDPKPFGTGDPTPSSWGSMETISGETGVSLWGAADSAVSDSAAKVQLQLAPDAPVVIGRMQNGRPSYLDPSYCSTNLVPGTGQPVVNSFTEAPDVYVSRAHFMLRCNVGGILLVNGVPGVDGAIRPPTNSTWLLEPTRRAMDPGEEYLIEHGASIALHLPNKAVVRISAE
jgi:hypothetical protein